MACSLGNLRAILAQSRLDSWSEDLVRIREGAFEPFEPGGELSDRLMRCVWMGLPPTRKHVVMSDLEFAGTGAVTRGGFIRFEKGAGDRLAVLDEQRELGEVTRRRNPRIIR